MFHLENSRDKRDIFLESSIEIFQEDVFKMLYTNYLEESLDFEMSHHPMFSNE